MRNRLLLVLIALAATAGQPSRTAADAALKIDVGPRMSTAPATLRVRAFVSPQADNRGLIIAADSGEFYRSTFVQLDGADAPRVTETAIKNLPAGEYDVAITLVAAGDRRVTVSQTVVVMASPGRR